MFTAAKTASTPLRVLLVGDHEEDFFLIREILERNRSLLVADLEHARSLVEAKELMRERANGLVLFQHDTEDVEAVRLIAEFLHSGLSIPFILLTEDADEKSVAEIIQSGTWNCLAKSHLDGATLVRTIRNTVALHCLRQESTTRKNLCGSCLAPSSSPPTRSSLRIASVSSSMSIQHLKL